MSGGRMKFNKDQVVRILTLEGKVSTEEYIVQVEVADGRGHVQLEEQGSLRTFKVNQRRIIPQSVNNGEAIVVESSNKYRAVCPTCPTVFDITPEHTSIECPEHGIFTLHWLGEKPVTDTTTPAANVAAPAKTAQPSTVKKEKKTRTPVTVDLAALSLTEGCELWTKSNVQFNHERIGVQSHALLFVGEGPRKLCWNTYDGTLGKKGRPLAIESFVAGESSKDSVPWYAIKNLDKERTKLAEKGYVHVT